MKRSLLPDRFTFQLPLVLFVGIACSKKVVEPVSLKTGFSGGYGKIRCCDRAYKSRQVSFFSKKSAHLNFNSSNNLFTNIAIDTLLTFQSMSDFGFSMMARAQREMLY